MVVSTWNGRVTSFQRFYLVCGAFLFSADYNERALRTCPWPLTYTHQDTRYEPYPFGDRICLCTSFARECRREPDTLGALSRS